MNEKILFLEIKERWQQEYVLANSADLPSIRFEKNGIAEAAGELRDVTVLSPFINSKILAAQFEKMPNLKLITTRSTGYDHIDTLEAKKRKVSVATVPAYGENTVAEHAFALILSLSRNLRKAYFKTKNGDFSLDGLMGFDLKGKTIGVIGTGKIGLHLIHMARGFGLEILACDVKKNDFLEDVLDFKYVPLEQLLSSSDIISLHAPHIPSTYHMIHSGNISKIKRGAILVNTSRGPLVETAALIKALDEGILAGAGLDVLEGEEMILEDNRLLETAENKESWEKMQLVLKNNILLHRDNVIYTPHMAFYSKEAVMRILDTTIGNIRSFLAGAPENTVKP